ncbi:MAG TPA: hypothetical protein DD640_03815 [Clostridiales bacterium]|nr:hypothetical protein [Clostridiales bacterium]
MDHHQPTRTAQRSRASLIVLIVLAFLLLAAAAVLVASLPDDAAGQLATAETTDDGLDKTGFACSASEAQLLYPFGAGVMKLSGTQVSFLDITGHEQFAADASFTNPFAVQTETLFLAADRDGYSYILFDTAGERRRGTLKERIAGASVSADGYLAIIQDQSSGTGIVTLIAPDTCEELFDCYFPESGYVLSVSFPPEGDCFDVALVNTSASAARPIIKRFSMTGEPIGQRMPDLDGLYPLITYDAAGNPVICCATGLAALTYGDDDLVWQRQFQQILAVRQSSGGLFVLAAESIDGPSSLYCLKSDGQDLFSLPAGEALADLDLNGSCVAVSGGTRVIAADSQTGEILLERDVSAEIIRIGFAGRKLLTVVTRSGVHALTIP